MASRINPGGLLAEYHALPGGPRVCLRLVRGRDAAGVRALYARHGTPLSELELEDGGRLARSLVVVDEELTDGLDALLVDALVAHADAMLRARAA